MEHGWCLIGPWLDNSALDVARVSHASIAAVKCACVDMESNQKDSLISFLLILSFFPLASRPYRTGCELRQLDAARAPKGSGFHVIMDKRMKPFKPVAFAQLIDRDHATWTSYASAQDTVILEQVTSNPAESIMHMVRAAVSTAFSERNLRQVRISCGDKCFS